MGKGNRVEFYGNISNMEFTNFDDTSSSMQFRETICAIKNGELGIA